MKIISKQTAMTLLAANPKLEAEKFWPARFTWRLESSYLGEEVDNIPGVHAVYVVRRTDIFGAYTQFMCIKEVS